VPESYEIDRADPGYQRPCMIPECPEAFNVLDSMLGPPDGNPAAVAGWYHAPRIFTGSLCPRHGPVALDHNPQWVRVNDVVTGCECPCGNWMWLPGIHQTMGAFKDRWAGHVAAMTPKPATPPPTTTGG
jgi:hypothetical protein